MKKTQHLMKPIVYVDMDNVVVDFPSAFAKLDPEILARYRGDEDDIPGIFALMEPMPGAIDALRQLQERFDLYLLSTAPWKNPSAWSDKVKWVQKHFGAGTDSLFYKRLIISHNKHLNLGDYLVDDRPKNGAEDFKGEWIHFGAERFPDWRHISKYLLDKKD